MRDEGELGEVWLRPSALTAAFTEDEWGQTATGGVSLGYRSEGDNMMDYTQTGMLTCSWKRE